MIGIRQIIKLKKIHDSIEKCIKEFYFYEFIGELNIQI